MADILYIQMILVIIPFNFGDRLYKQCKNA